jgi:hypothetical protein
MPGSYFSDAMSVGVAVALPSVFFLMMLVVCIVYISSKRINASTVRRFRAASAQTISTKAFEELLMSAQHRLKLQIVRSPSYLKAMEGGDLYSNKPFPS